MFKKFKTDSNYGDALTGERILPGEFALDTAIRNKPSPWSSRGRNKIIKESTIVWLAEEAGLKICGNNCDCESDERVSESAPRVESEDVGVGNGTGEAGKSKVGGKSSSKRSTVGSTKD